MDIKLSEVPCESQPAILNSEEANIIKKVVANIHFPNRDLYRFSFLKQFHGYTITAYLECPNRENGLPIQLSHTVRFDSDAKNFEKNVVKNIFLVVGQIVMHEFAENYRHNDVVIYDPHLGERNTKMFKAVEALCEPISERVTSSFTINFEPIRFLPNERRDLPNEKATFSGTFTGTLPTPEFDTLKPKEHNKPPRKTEGFAKFFHDDKVKFKRGA